MLKSPLTLLTKATSAISIFYGEKIECSREAAYVELSLEVSPESENYIQLSHPEFPAMDHYNGEQYIRLPINPTQHVLHPALNQTIISSTKHEIKQWTCNYQCVMYEKNELYHRNLLDGREA